MNRLFRAAWIRGTFSAAPLLRQHRAPGTAGLETAAFSLAALLGREGHQEAHSLLSRNRSLRPESSSEPSILLPGPSAALGRWSYKDNGEPQDMDV